MKKQSGFGSISGISIVALPFLLIAVVLLATQGWSKWQRYKEERAELIGAVESQRQELYNLRSTVERGQAGIADVRDLSDVVKADAKQTTNLLTQLELEGLSMMDPEEAARLMNEIYSKQLEDLREASQKDWKPEDIDNGK